MRASSRRVTRIVAELSCRPAIRCRVFQQPASAMSVRVALMSVLAAATLTIGWPRAAILTVLPIPKAGPLAQPKSIHQVGVPAAATRAAIPPDNPQTPANIPLAPKLFFDGRLPADGT